MRIFFTLFFFTLVGIAMVAGGLYSALKRRTDFKRTMQFLCIAAAGSVILLILRFIKWIIELRIHF